MDLDLKILPPLPNKRDFRIGILGSGFVVNECHLPAYRKAGFNPVAIASRNLSTAHWTAQRHGIAKVYDECEELLDDPSIEVLDIAVPPQAQLDLIKQACARKTVRGILAQKPLGVNYAQAAEAAEACARAGIVLSVNQNMRYDQSVRAARALLENPVIGRPVFATIEMRGIPHWMPWQAELGWATLRVMSIHHLDCFRYWFGDPAGIYCSVTPDPRAEFRHYDGICSYILDYPNGLRCVGIDDPWTGPAREGCPSDIYVRWRIEGTHGLAMGDIGWCREPFTTPSTIKYATRGDAAFHQPKWTESWFPDAFAGTMGQLLIALETGTEPAISAADNLKTMALVEAAYSSSQENVFAHINPADVVAPRKLPFVSEAKPRADHPDAEAEMFRLSTPRARQVLALARKEADHFHHAFVSPEHLLLGIMRLGNGPAFNILAKAGLDLPKLREEVTKEAGPCPEQKASGRIPYAPRLTKLLQSAVGEAKALHHNYVTTEHVLLALLGEGDGVVPIVLKNLSVDVEKVRFEVMQELINFLGNVPITKSQKPGLFGQWLAKKKPENALRNFTPRAQQVLALARKEADRFNHNFVGTEHVLLGLMALGQGVAVNVLGKLGLDLKTVRLAVEKQIGTGPDLKMIGNIPYTPRVKKVLVLASKEAKNLGHTYVGTEHILLGLMLEGGGVASRVFQGFKVDVEAVRKEILAELDPSLAGTAAAPVAPALETREMEEIHLPREPELTPHARQSLKLARQEVERLKRPAIEPEHILFGLIALGQGLAFNALLALRLDLGELRGEIEKRSAASPTVKTAGHIAYSPLGLKALSLASLQAKALHHSFIGTEHILLGLLAQGEGSVRRILEILGVDSEKARDEVLKEIERIFGK